MAPFRMNTAELIANTAEEASSGTDNVVHLGIHDRTRLEWAVSIPMPATGKRAYAIEVELDIPSNAVAQGSEP